MAFQLVCQTRHNLIYPLTERLSVTGMFLKKLEPFTLCALHRLKFSTSIHYIHCNSSKFYLFIYTYTHTFLHRKLLQFQGLLIDSGAYARTTDRQRRLCRSFGYLKTKNLCSSKLCHTVNHELNFALAQRARITLFRVTSVQMLYFDIHSKKHFCHAAADNIC